MAQAVAEHGGSAGTETARTRGWQQSPCLAPGLPRAQAAGAHLAAFPLALLGGFGVTGCSEGLCLDCVFLWS